jgi:hypothetical protein
MLYLLFPMYPTILHNPFYVLHVLHTPHKIGLGLAYTVENNGGTKSSSGLAPREDPNNSHS